MVASFYSMALAGLFNPFLRNLAFGALAAMLVFALFGKWLQSNGAVGQVAFIAFGVLAIIFTVNRIQIKKRRNLSYPAEVNLHGDSLCVRIPREICNHYRLNSGDQVRVIILQLENGASSREAAGNRMIVAVP
jgi:hypothetical protein